MGKKKKKQMSIDEIVNDVLANIDEKSKDIIAQAEPDMFGSYTSQFHFSLGIHIRNKYNLWDYGNADDISAYIINKVVNKVKKQKNT